MVLSVFHARNERPFRRIPEKFDLVRHGNTVGPLEGSIQPAVIV